MAVFKDAYLSVNGSDLSTYVRSVELPLGAELYDDTTMGDTARVNAAGLLTWSVTAELKQDFANVDAVLHPLVGAAAFAVIIKPNGSVTGASNPAFSGNGVIESYQPFGGSVGDNTICTVTLQCAGTLSRAVV
jgi:hypothetical protein